MKEMEVLERLNKAGVVPVAVIEKEKDAVPLANALLNGGIDVIEITFRTAAAKDSISRVTEACPDMLVGAGTVLNLEQCKDAVNAGAKFIVSPGCCDEVICWCQEQNIAVIPGCVTPTEITRAIAKGLKILKFFPANVYGGLSAMKSLAGPFGGIRFIPTGGVSETALTEYLSASFIYAVGGSWLCSKTDIAENNFEKITALCQKAHDIVLQIHKTDRD